MGGGSDDGGGYNPALFQNAPAIPGVPVASPGGGGGTDPYNYGKYQSFLPVAGSAHGLTDDMFKYRTPNEIMNPGTSSPWAGKSSPSAPSEPQPAKTTGRYLYDPATGAQVGGLAGMGAPGGARDYLAGMMEKRRQWQASQGQPAPAPAPPTPPPATQTAPTPDWMTASMTG